MEVQKIASDHTVIALSLTAQEKAMLRDLCADIATSKVHEGTLKRLSLKAIDIVSLVSMLQQIERELR